MNLRGGGRQGRKEDGWMGEKEGGGGGGECLKLTEENKGSSKGVWTCVCGAGM